MKKIILIGCSVLGLFALIWAGARTISATAETDVSAGEEKKRYAVSNGSKEAASSEEPEEDAAEEDAEDAIEEETGDKAEEVEAASLEEEEGSSDSDLVEAVSEITESAASDENVLYQIETSTGSNLGMVPIVNGNAIVLMDGSHASTYQGDYAPEEMSALTLKLEEEAAQALSSGEIDAWAFYRESQLRDFEFPEGITSIDKFAFARSGLNSITIPEGVTTIGYSAFYHCDSLSDVMIPKSVTTIEENAFAYTPWLENWLAGGEDAEEESEEESDDSEAVEADDFLIVGDGILLAYRGSVTNPELPPEVKSVAPGALGE